MSPLIFSNLPWKERAGKKADKSNAYTCSTHFPLFLLQSGSHNPAVVLQTTNHHHNNGTSPAVKTLDVGVAGGFGRVNGGVTTQDAKPKMFPIDETTKKL